MNKLSSLLFVLILAACAAPGDHSSSPNPNGRHDAWGFTGYGGGGAMFHPAVSPHDPNHVFVACDMTGSYVTYDGGETWRMFNLRSPVDYFVFDPSDPNVVYANSIALFKSLDRGHTWSVFYPQPRDVTGVVSKGDHANEILVPTDSVRRRVQAFAVDPQDSRKLYAAISRDNTSAFYISEDGGKSWSKEQDLAHPAQNVFVDPSSSADDRTVYITTRTGVIARKGGNWTTHSGPQEVKSLTSVTGGLDRTANKFILYAMSGESYFNPEGDRSGIHYSEDGGATWENRQEGMLQYVAPGHPAPEWRAIATSALNAGTVYVSYNNLQTDDNSSSIGVARSDDFGKTWKLVWQDRLAPGNNTVASNYESGWLNPRFGPTWGENPFSLGVSANDPGICYGTDFGRTSRTLDGGQTWQQVYTRKHPSGNGWISRGLEVTTSYGIFFNPFEPDHVFIANTDVGLMESIDGGESWRSATENNGIPRPWINSTYWMAFDPAVKGRAWAVMSGSHDLPRPKMFRRNGTAGYKGGVLITDDAGKTWTPVSNDIGEAGMTHILLDERSDKDNRVLYACAFGKGVYKSVDGGRSWQQKNVGITGEEPLAWRITQRPSDGALFLVVCRRSEDGSIGNAGDGALYRSDDGAESWVKISLPDGANGPMSVVIDTRDEQRMILGTWGRRTSDTFTPDIGGGIFVTNDGGVNWHASLTSDQHIHDITYDHRKDAYYACGFNGSAYRSTDRGDSWQRLRGYNFKWGKRVEPDPRDPNKVYIITFGGGVWHGPAKGDPDASEDIVPALPAAREPR